MGAKGVVAAGHGQTAGAASRILTDGGNAFDAVLAAMCTACVAEPVLASLGGGGFLLARPAGAPARVHDFFVQSPRRHRSPEELDFERADLDFGTARQPFWLGLGSVATPGVVRGLFEVQRSLGSRPMREIVAHAVELARDGVEINPYQAHLFEIVRPIVTARPCSRAVFAGPERSGQLPRHGERIRFPDLAATFEQLALEGDDLFYRGDIARRIVERSRTGGGCVFEDDLAGYRVVCREPLSVDYRGARVHTNPPPASGGSLIAFALKLLEAAGDLSSWGFGSSEHLQLLADVMGHTNEARAEVEAAGTGWERVLEPGLLERYRRDVVGRARSRHGTTHIDVIDRDGNVASLTLSNGAGSGEVVPDTGIMLNNMLGEDDLLCGGFHRWPPNRRVSSMMAPTVVERADGSLIATGSGGSKRIRTAILQVLVNLLDFRMDVEEAVRRPRLFLEDGKLSIEGGFDAEVVRRLTVTYPDNEQWPGLNLFFGGAHTVERRGQEFHGAGDTRRGGLCVLVR